MDSLGSRSSRNSKELFRREGAAREPLVVGGIDRHRVHGAAAPLGDRDAEGVALHAVHLDAGLGHGQWEAGSHGPVKETATSSA